MPTLPFFTFLFFAFITVNLIFTGLYLLVGLEELQGISGNSNFFDAFYFSAQTITTVGYGGLHPTGNALSLIAGFEAFIGLLGFAVATGLLYGRFSKPKTKMLFSDNALISPYNNITGLMIRVANPKNNQLIDAGAKMIFSQIENENGINKRKFYTLDLEMSSISLFAASWTVVHPINEDSPLFGISTDDIKSNNVELIVLINAYDESYNQNIHARTSYKPNEIIMNAKFSPILGHNSNNEAIIRLDKINEFEKLKD